jgi:ADP-heptose:LPS heptosyltransferase
MRTPPALEETLFDDVAAFYVIRERGISAALRDMRAFRNWARQRLAPGDTLIFETRGIRTRWLVPRRDCQVLQVSRRHGAYVDREQLLRPFIGRQNWPPCIKPKTPAKRLLINPTARAQARFLSIAVVKKSLCIAAAVGTEVCLIDVDGRYESLRADVQSYMRAPKLQEAVAALRASDRYLGPDSFFMHLAYYYRIPFLAFFSPMNTYFMPPGAREQDTFIFYSNAEATDEFETKFHRLLAPVSEGCAANV